jgi:hypothetical protein
MCFGYEPHKEMKKSVGCIYQVFCVCSKRIQQAGNCVQAAIDAGLANMEFSTESYLFDPERCRFQPQLPPSANAKTSLFRQMPPIRWFYVESPWNLVLWSSARRIPISLRWDRSAENPRRCARTAVFCLPTYSVVLKDTAGAMGNPRRPVLPIFNRAVEFCYWGTDSLFRAAGALSVVPLVATSDPRYFGSATYPWMWSLVMRLITICTG